MKSKIKGTLLIAVVFAISMVACSNQSKNNDSDTSKTNNSKTENSMTSTTTKKTINLTRADFLEKVANFEESPDKWVYRGDKPAIIDFYADWCGPCKMIAPILEELAAEYEGQIYIYKVDTEAEQQLAGEFGIRSIPSLLFVPMEGDPQMAQGALPKDAFKQAIEEVLLNNK